MPTRQNPQHQNELGGAGLTFKLPAIDHEIALRERHLPGHLGAQILYGTDQIAPGDVGRDDDTSSRSLSR